MDTNVIVSGLYSKRGASYQLLKDAVSGELSYAVSPLIALEYEGVIHQHIERGLLKASLRNYERILDALFANALKVWKPAAVRPVLSDTSDDKILECAIAGECNYIVTFNKRHFPEPLTRPFKINVKTSGEFLAIRRNMT